jgi:hypothetical protein
MSAAAPSAPRQPPPCELFKEDIREMLDIRGCCEGKYLDADGKEAFCKQPLAYHPSKTGAIHLSSSSSGTRPPLYSAPPLPAHAEATDATLCAFSANAHVCSSDF